MNVFLALTASLVFLVAPSLGDGDQCTGVNSFTAITFDNIRFRSTRSYHAVPEGLTRYVNLDDNGMTLWDFNKGNIWVMNDDGSCIQYNSDDLAVSLYLCLARMHYNFLKVIFVPGGFGPIVASLSFCSI